MKQHNKDAGAVDLLPFHPVGDGTMADASATSAAVAQRIGINAPLRLN